MTRAWRNTAIVLFAAALVVGGLVGEKLLALTGEAQSQLRLYTELMHLAHENYGDEVAYRDLVYSSIQGMLRTLDPHTTFLTPEYYDRMRERQQASFYGLGILVSMRNGQLTIINPIEGTPAWRLGLRAGDVISTIEGEPTDTMTLDEAVSRLKGPKDTQVNIRVVRRGLDEPLDLTITRAEIPQTTVRYAYMMDSLTGYVRLTDFARSTTSEMSDALERLRGEGMERLLLDLRNNGGGLLDQTVTVSELFVPQRTMIVETRGRVANSYQSFYSENSGEPFAMPLVVLVNDGTASAAEILAGAIQDHDVGLVVGTATWGKGLVQTVYNLSYGTGLALTTAKYYTPSGRLIQRDYSSYFDYYTHFDNIASADGVPEIPVEGPEFSTDLGRTVFGGGGITPDIVVEPPDGPTMLGFLFARGAFFDFATEYANRHPIDDPAWNPDEEILDEFRAWLIAEEIATAEEIEEVFADAEARDFARARIRADVFNATLGPVEAHRVVAAEDVQIQAALGLFDQAAELLNQRRSLGKRQ